MYYLYLIDDESEKTDDDNEFEYQFIISSQSCYMGNEPIITFSTGAADVLDTATRYIDQNYKQRSSYYISWA